MKTNTQAVDVLAARAAEILAEPYTDRENLAIRIARLEQRDAAVAELVEAVKEKLAADDAHFGGERSHATARRVDAADVRLRAALGHMGVS